MDNEIITIIIAVVGQLIIISYVYGKLTARQASIKENIVKLEHDINALSKKIESNVKSSFDYFVSIEKCNGINQNWKTEVKSLVAQRDLHNQQNVESHKQLSELMYSIANEMKKDRENFTERLDGISDCLHKMQNKRDC